MLFTLRTKVLYVLLNGNYRKDLEHSKVCISNRVQPKPSETGMDIEGVRLTDVTKTLIYFNSVKRAIRVIKLL